MRTRWVTVNDRMQHGYRYTRTAPAGRDFPADFRPELTPQQMLELGVFGGKYLTDCTDEFPASWFRGAGSHRRRDPGLNCFGVDASQSLPVGARRAGSIPMTRAAGSSGTAATTWAGACRRERQIRRWKAMRRHVAQLERDCEPRRPGLPPPTEAGAAALGVRQPQDLTVLLQQPLPFCLGSALGGRL